MKATFLFVFVASAFGALACSAPTGDDSGTSSDEQALRVGHREVPGAHWERSVECDGAHFDRLRTNQQDPNSAGLDKNEWQLVIENRGAADYLNGKVEEQKRSPIGLDTIDASNAAHGDGEIVLYLGSIAGTAWYDGARQASFSTEAHFANGQGWVQVNRFESFVDQGSGNFRKANDLKVTYQRAGWSDTCVNDWQIDGCTQYRSGGTEPKPGWSSFEIANWVFRGCRNL